MKQPEIARRYRRTVIAALVSAAFVATANAAPVTWVGPNGSFWDLAANWNPGLPGAADDALLGAFDTTFRSVSGTVTILSFSGTGTFSITGGSLTATNASSTGGFTMTGGTLAGTGVVTVSGVASLSGGDQLGAGTTVLAGGGSISGGIGLDTGRTLRVGDGVNPSTVNWTAGTIQLNATSTGVAAAGILATAVNGVLSTSFNGSIGTSNFGGLDNGASARFDNAGTFRKTGLVGGTTNVNVQFNNTGAVEVENGTISLNAGGTSTGSFAVSAPATLQFGGGTHTLDGSAATGAGRLLVSAGTVNTAGTVSFGGLLEISGGALNAGGAVNAVALTQSGGALSGTGLVTVSGVASLSGGDQLGAGTTVLAGGGSISGPIGLDTGRTLRVGDGVNPSTVNWTAGTIQLNATSTGVAAAGILATAVNGVLSTSFNGSIGTSNFGGLDNGASARFDNAGTFRKTGLVGGTTNVNVQFNNTGAVEVENGTISLNAGGTHTGSFAVSTGATLQFAAGTHALNGSPVTGTGRMLVSGGIVNTSGAVTLAGLLEISGGALNAGGAVNAVALTQSGGALSGTGLVTVSGVASLSGGDQLGAGTTVLAGGGSISGPIGLDTGRTLRVGDGVNPSTVNWTAGTIQLNATSTGVAAAGILATAVNGVLSTSFNGSIGTSNFGGLDNGASARFDNAGTFRKTGLVGGTTNVNVQFNNTGAVEVENGTISLNAGGTSTGSFAVSAPATLQFGGGTHTLDGSAATGAGRLLVSAGTVNTAGTVSFGGLLEISGGALNAGGAVNAVALTQSGGALSGTGLVTVSGVASLSGGDQLGAGTTVLAGGGSISGPIGLDTGRTLRVGDGVNPSTVNWTAGTIQLNATSTGVAAAGILATAVNGVLSTSFNGSIGTSNFGGLDNGASARFDNAGTFRKTGLVGGTTNVNVQFNNTGAVEVENGTISLNAGGTSTGSFAVSAPATLQFGGGTHTLDGSAATGAGRLLVSAGTVNTAGTVSFGGLLEISGGALNAGGAVNAVALTQSGGALSGTGLVTVSGVASLSGGDQLGAGTTVLAGGGSISGPIGLDTGRTLRVGDGVNPSTVNWTAGTIQLNATSTGVAAAGILATAVNGVLSTSFNGSIGTSNFGGLDNGASARFDNAGTFRKTGLVGGTTNVNVQFNNTGAVEVENGTISLNAGGTHTGSFAVSTGATLQFGAGTHALNGSPVTGTGRVLLSGGIVTVNTGDTVVIGTAFTQVGGVLNGTGLVTVNGLASLNGGDQLGAGTTVLAGGGGIIGTGLDTGRTLRVGDGVNPSTVNWTAGAIQLNATSTGVAPAGILATAVNGVLSTSFNGAILASNFGGLDNGASARFDNAGTFRKTGGGGSTNVNVQFNNTGAVEVQDGTINLSGGGTHTSSFAVSSGATLQFSGGTHLLNNVTSSGEGQVSLSGGTVTVNTGDTVVIGTAFTQVGGVLNGTGLVTVNGLASLNGGDQLGAGTTVLAGGGGIIGTGLDTGRTLRVGDGVNPSTLNWTAGAIQLNATSTGVAPAGILATAVNGVLSTSFNGAILASNFGGLDNGASARFDNAGTFRKTGGGGSTNVNVQFNNTGVAEVQNGTMSFSNVTQHVGTSLTGGTWIASDGTLTFTTGSNITTNQGNVTLSGAASVFARINAIADNQGTFTIQNGRTFTTAGALTNSGTATAGVGGTLNFAGAVTNSGSLVSSGVMTATAAITGAGVVQINPGGQINLGGASTAATLINNGTTANALNLGANNITVSNDYQNANFGSGNSFNRRTNVAGAGLILSSHATPNLQQSLSGNIAGGTTTGNATMAFGNVHVGEAVTRNYEVNNAAGGPILRGAIQTTANGGNLTDARLTGTGVTAGNFGPLAAGAGSGNLAVTLLAPVSGPINLLGQQVALVNNFDNTNSQLLSITAGGAYAFASPSAATPSPVSFGSVRLGTTASQALSMTNTDVALAGFQEALNASISTASAGVNASGSFNGLGQGATNNTSLVVGIDTASVGNKSGTATIALQSDGAGTSGLGITALPSQIVDISGTVWRVAAASAATPNPIAFTNARVGDLKTQALTIGNTAAADGFSEGLRASIGGATGNVSVNGATGLIAAGGNGGGMSLTLDTSAAGARSGSATITLQSDGAGTSGLAPIGIGTQTVNASGNVYQVAQPSAVTPNPLVLANQRVGGTLAQALTLTNTSDAPVGFQEALNAAFSGTTGGAIANGAINLLGQGVTNNTSLLVGVNTATAGAKSGTATLGLTSDGTGTSGLGTLALTSQIVNVTGNVYNAAVGSTTPSPAVVANQRVGGAGGVALTVNNTAPGGLFSEALNAAFAAPTGDATHNGGGVSNLIAGGSNNSAMNVGVNTATAGAKSGTVTLNYQTDGTGANGNSGLAAIAAGNQVITVSGNVYQVAQPTLASNTISFANRHVGAAATQALSLTNTSAAPAGFQEALNANFSGNTGAATSSGSVTGLAQGASNTTNLLVGLDTSTAGAKSGTATLALASNGAGTSGLAPLGLTDQLVTVSGNVYRLAQALLTNPLSFGNVLVGSGPTTRNVSITNTALNDGFSEALNASFGTLTNTGVGSLSSAGAINLLGAGQTNNTSMQVTLNPTAQGTVSATVQILLASDGTGTSGLGVTALPNQVLTIDGLITANAGILAQASAATPNPVSFGKFRVGGPAAPTQTLSIQNVAAGAAEGLNASIGTGSAGFTAAGAFTGLAPGATNATSLNVGFTDTATAGAKSGTATITLASDGSFNAGVTTALPSQTVNMSAEVYRLAQAGVAAPNPITFNNARVGDVRTQALTIGNTALNDGFSEGLRASIGSATGNVSVAGATGLIAAGNSGTGMSATLDTSAAGARSGSATITLQSDGAGTSGFGTLGIGTQTLNVAGNVYQLAAGTLNSAPLNFGTVQVGQAVSQTLSISNSALGPSGFVEDLNARFGTTSGTGAAAIGGTGQIAGLSAGATNATNMVVSVNTSTAQTINGAIAVDFFSAGTVNGVSNALGELGVGSTPFAVSGLIEAAGTVIDQARPVTNGTANPAPVAVSLGNVRIGAAATQSLSVQNQATGGAQAALNASIASNGAPITAAGSFNLLAPGATNTSALQVGMDTAAAGAKSGSATIGFVSDASNVGGCAPSCELNLPSQTVNVSGAVYRLASPVLNTANVSLAARVGDAAPSGAISVTNSSPDVFTEGLKASLGATPAGFTGSGSIANLVAGGTDASSLRATLNTAVAGSFGGPLEVSFVSTGEGTTGAADLALGSAPVTLSGKVYTPAVAQVAGLVDFGIVHKGEAVATRNVAVANSAALSALNDVLRGSFGGAGAAFAASGNLGAGLIAGAGADTTSFNVALSTANAGVFNGTATATLASHNADLADLGLADAQVTLTAQVNNFANAALVKRAGEGTLGGGGLSYTLDLGSILRGTGLHRVTLGVLNDVLGPADLLDGEFDLGLVDEFALAGFDPFADLAAGVLQEGLVAALDTDLLSLGTYVDTIVLSALVGHNASGFSGRLEDITLVLRAQVIEATGVVPEPGTLALLVLGMIVLMRRMRRVPR